MTRLLYVVSRDRPDLYSALRATFVESQRLAIILDRREPTPAAVPDERRRLPLDEPLRTRGWARVRIDADGHAALV